MVRKNPATLNTILIAVLPAKATGFIFVESLQEPTYHRGVHSGQLCLLAHTLDSSLAPVTLGYSTQKLL